MVHLHNGTPVHMYNGTHVQWYTCNVHIHMDKVGDAVCKFNGFPSDKNNNAVSVYKTNFYYLSSCIIIV